jgi:hypothetical protein
MHYFIAQDQLAKETVTNAPVCTMLATSVFCAVLLASAVGADLFVDRTKLGDEFNGIGGLSGGGA